jgi:hypothetical protein
LNLKTLTVVFVFFISVFSSCKKDSPTEVFTGHGYFPVEIGHWVEYDVDSIVYNDFTGLVDTFRYQVRELIESDFVDDAGRPSKRIERFKKSSDTLDWQISDVWYCTVTSFRAEKTEENIKYVKLIFPVKKGKNWDGNAFNNIGSWDYEYTEVNEPLLLGTQIFDSTLTVQQIEDFNLIETINYKEVYAMGVGLIKKEIIDLKTEVNGTIKSGIKYYKTYRNHGKQ